MLSSATLNASSTLGATVGVPSRLVRNSLNRCLLLRRSRFCPSGLVIPLNSRTFLDGPLPRLLDMVAATATACSASMNTAAVELGSHAVDSSDPADKVFSACALQSAKKKYHFVVANAKFMLDEEEHFKELLFERLRNYSECHKEQDFWLVVEPKFLDKFPDIMKRLRRPAVALVSTNGPWITFMKLRLDRVLHGSYEGSSVEEALAAEPAELEFQRAESWAAPYPKYEAGWWEPFLPPGFD